MKYRKCVQRLAAFVLGFTIFFLLQESHPETNSLSENVNRGKSEIFGASTKDVTSTIPPKRFSSLVMATGDNFISVYVRSVFCNKKMRSVPLNSSTPSLTPGADVVSGKDLVVLVISSPVHTELREAIRRTWASTGLTGVAVIFLLGRHWDQYWNSVITQEHAKFGDILQVITPDTYRKLPEKILLGFQWVLGSVPGVRYVVKSDDDVYLYLPNVLSLVRDLTGQEVIVGAFNPHSIVSRNKNDDWGVSKDIYLPDYFPPYVSGGSYLMSAHVTRRILNALSTCRRLHIEDVFITGILALSARIGHLPHGGFSYWGTPKPHPCDMRTGRVNSVNMSIKQIYKLHQTILNLNSSHLCKHK